MSIIVYACIAAIAHSRHMHKVENIHEQFYATTCFEIQFCEVPTLRKKGTSHTHPPIPGIWRFHASLCVYFSEVWLRPRNDHTLVLSSSTTFFQCIFITTMFVLPRPNQGVFSLFWMTGRTGDLSVCFFLVFFWGGYLYNLDLYVSTRSLSNFRKID